MGIVRLALRRSYTFVVVALLILVLGIVTIARMPVHFFPDVSIPVVTAIWSFTGMSLDDARVRFQAILIGRDFGTTVEVAGGLTEADRLLVAPPDALQDGTLVRVSSSSAAVGPSRPSREH